LYPLYTYREIARRKSRTLEIVITVAVLVALLISVSTIMDSYLSAVYAPFQNVGADLILQKGGPAAADISSSVRAPFGKVPFTPEEIRAIGSLGYSRNISSSLVVWSFQKDGFSTVEGVDPVSPLGVKLRSGVTSGVFLNTTQSNTAVLESHYARFNHKVVGDQVDIGGEPFQVVGIEKVIEGSQIFSSNMYVNLPDAQRVSHINGTNQIYLGLDDVAHENAVRNDISGIDPQIIVYSGNNLASSLGNVAGIFQQFYLVVIGFVIIIAAVILGKMSVTALLERRREIGVMQSVGWTGRDIIIQLTAELSVKVIAGCLAGVLLAFIFAYSLGSITVQTRPVGLAEPIVIGAPLIISPLIAFGYVILMFVIALAVSYLLGRRIVMTKPSENLRRL
jgi:ABC-type antimicrobial peptide transport system permease subunit